MPLAKAARAGEAAEALHGREARADLFEVGEGAGDFHLRHFVTQSEASRKMR